MDLLPYGATVTKVSACAQEACYFRTMDRGGGGWSWWFGNGTKDAGHWLPGVNELQFLGLIVRFEIEHAGYLTTVSSATRRAGRSRRVR